MTIKTTAGMALINAQLPPAMRRWSTVYDKKGVQNLFDELADKHPDEYSTILQKLTDVGARVSTSTGGMSYSHRHLAVDPRVRAMRQRLEDHVDAILDRTDIDEDAKHAAIVEATTKMQKPIEDAVYEAAIASGNPLGQQVLSGARGSKTNLRSLTGGDLLYNDYKLNPLPIPVTRSYAEGLTPAQYIAGSFGARRAISDTKLATADAGYLGKQMVQIGHRLLVVGQDHPEADTRVSEYARGLPVDTGDRDNIGALLAHDIGGFKRNHVIDAATLDALKRKGHERILVRSPTVGGPESGVWSRDLGIREKRRLPPRGDFVGISGLHALSEKLNQGQLCLAHDELVQMANGETEFIENLMPGDQVIAPGSILANWLPQVVQPVTVVCRYDHGPKLTKEYEFGNISVVRSRCTPDHKFLCGESLDDILQMLPISEICKRRNLRVVAVRGDNNLRLLRPKEVLNSELITHCHDIEIDHPDHAFCLANGLICSNSAKHGGGVAGQDASVYGFPLIDQLLQTPEMFRGGAAHSEVDGQVQSIVEAPQGGWYVSVNDVKHYVGKDFKPTVARGDRVEAGDVLSTGLPNPELIVKHKHIGEGRRYFTHQFRKAMLDSGMHADRRNVELLARGLVDHVHMDAEYGGYLPGDVVSYTTLENHWQPRNDHVKLAPKRAIGKYLEQPALHYTIGTKIQPSVAEEFGRFGVDKIAVHDEPPPWTPQMTRAAGFLEHDPDPMTRHLGSNLQKSTLRAVHRGETSDPQGTSFVPALTLDPGSFGLTGATKAWEPPKATKTPTTF